MGVSTPEGKFIFLFRSALFVGLGSVVATIIYLTPIPDQFPQSCQRRCHELDWPMICRVKMSVDQVPCYDSDCSASGLSVNHHQLGPTIQVCENDIVMVDVTNRAVGKSLSVHWRGQILKETPHMDGVSMITQCPIIPFTTFQYKFRASEAGTHFWQFSPTIENLFGPFIVKQSANRDIHRGLYDTDNHIFAIHIQNKKIVVGSTEQDFLANFTQGVRHRVRMLFGGVPQFCRLRFYAKNLPVTLLALDGHPTKPEKVAGIEFGFGERVDFMIQILENDAEFYIEAENDCDVIDLTLPVQVFPSSKKYESSDESSLPMMRTVVDNDCMGKVCLLDLKTAQNFPPELVESRLDHKIFLFFGVRQLARNSNATILARWEDSWGAPHINNKTMILPSSPIMSQLEDIDPNLMCNLPCVDSKPCECVHIIHIPLMDTVELILAHQGGGPRRAVFHLHGNSFYVVGATQLESYPNTEDLIQKDIDEKFITRNLKNPVKKDSVSIPEKGIIILRFTASNPGYWLLDQELTLRGMQVLLHVGEASDLPNTPNNFPKCGSWVGPEFFLA